MGCDIHLRLEIKPKKEQNKSTTWQPTWCFGYNNCWTGSRIYGVFAVLANVRNYWDLDYIQLRGLPSDMSNATKRAFSLEVKSDADYQMLEKDYPVILEYYCPQSDANKWLEQKMSIPIILEGIENSQFITNPDYHSFNWCTTQEMENAINKIFIKDGKYDGNYVEWFGLLGLMKGYEASGEYECRAVYCFDN